MSETPEANLSSGDQISEAFQKILQNPDIISNVAAAIGMPMPTKKDAPPQKSSVNTPEAAETISSLAPLLSTLSKKDSSHKISSNQASLLNALKPYVNDNRCQAIDYIIKIAEISQLMKKTN